MDGLTWAADVLPMLESLDSFNDVKTIVDGGTAGLLTFLKQAAVDRSRRQLTTSVATPVGGKTARSKLYKDCEEKFPVTLSLPDDLEVVVEWEDMHPIFKAIDSNDAVTELLQKPKEELTRYVTSKKCSLGPLVLLSKLRQDIEDQLLDDDFLDGALRGLDWDDLLPVFTLMSDFDQVLRLVKDPLPEKTVLQQLLSAEEGSNVARQVKLLQLKDLIMPSLKTALGGALKVRRNS